MEDVHSKEYLSILKRTCSTSSGSEFDKYGLSYDCPPHDQLFFRARLLFGATMAAARAINEGTVRIAINWLGGWHHGMRDRASGFCYVNDINGAIQYLVNQGNKVLYVISHDPWL